MKFKEREGGRKGKGVGEETGGEREERKERGGRIDNER